MTLKELLGEDYKEEMTVEEVELALSGKTLVDPNTLPKTVKKDVFDKVASELAQLKRENKELKTSQLSDEEALKEKLKEADELKQQYILDKNRIKAQEIFVGAGLVGEEIDKLLSMAVSETEEQTIQKAQSLIDVIASKTEATQRKTKEELIKGTPQPKIGGQPNLTITKEAFDKFSYKERVELMNTQPEEYKRLTEQ